MPPSSPIGQRLKREMKQRGLTAAALAKLADVRQSFLYDVLNGKSAHPSTLTLARVAEALGMELSALAGGSGAGAGAADGSAREYVAIPRVMVDSAEDGLVLASLMDEHAPQRFHAGWIAEVLGCQPKNLRSFTQRGGVMAPTLLSGDTLLVDISQTAPATPGMFLIHDGRGLTVRRLEYSAGNTRLRVTADSPDFKPYECSIADASIAGRIVWWSRTL